jgi:hypothetical protein
MPTVYKQAISSSLWNHALPRLSPSHLTSHRYAATITAKAEPKYRIVKGIYKMADKPSRKHIKIEAIIVLFCTASETTAWKKTPGPGYATHPADDRRCILPALYQTALLLPGREMELLPSNGKP